MRGAIDNSDQADKFDNMVNGLQTEDVGVGTDTPTQDTHSEHHHENELRHARSQTEVQTEHRGLQEPQESQEPQENILRDMDREAEPNTV